MENTKTVQMPIDKMSYSGLTQLLRNPIIFKLKYILGVYDSKKGVSAMIGSAVHEALKFYYGGDKDRPVSADPIEARADALQIGLDYLEDYDDSYIKYGKTGNRENMLTGYHQAMTFYFAEEPEYNEILACEERMEAEIKTYDGQIMSLPAVGKPDIVHKRKDGGVEIIDTKIVKSFTKYENDDGDPFEDYIKIIQAKFLDRLLFISKGIKADRVLFREVKRTANKDGSQQIRDYAIPLAHEPYDIIFDNLYKDTVKFISNPDSIYLPNLSDPFDGESAGMLYAQGLLSSDMSDVEVMHKVKDVAFVSKKFVASRLEKIENAHLPPEEKIKMRMAEFGIPMEHVETKTGASVTQYQFKVSRGVRMSVFAKHKNDISGAIEAKSEIRILAPIPGTALIGIEVPTEDRKPVMLDKKHYTKDTLMIPVGVDVHDEIIRVPLNEMPHLLIAGATGSGKSVLLSSIITALTKQMTPDAMRLILIDPKRVELSAFENLKHLKGGKISYEYEEAMFILRGLSNEMEARYKTLKKAKVRDITAYNADEATRAPEYRKPMPYIVVVIDEFADLMLQGKVVEKRKKKQQSADNMAQRAVIERMSRQFAKMGMTYKPEIEEEDDRSVEEMIARLAALARAVGIHLIIATQRPSVDVITGLIKANFPTRIALTTSSAIDSKVILGEEGAEKLGGKGDMLFMHPGGGKVRLQGLLVK